LIIALAALTGVERFGANLLWHLGFVSNFYFMHEGRYVGACSQFWFIAVEQQFYLFWPLVLFLIPLKRGLMAPAGLMALGVFFRILAGILGWNDLTIDVMTPGAFETLGAGALLAFSPGRWVPVIGLAGAGLLGARMWASGSYLGPAVSLLVNELGRGLVLAWVVAKATGGIPGWIGRMLESRLARELGFYSYGMFLSHNFFYAAAHRRPWTTWGWPEPALVGVALALTLLWSAVLYYGFERPLTEISRRPAPVF
jgi:peptidoglycan/LPS O-acetylase OafA/YrhL